MGKKNITSAELMKIYHSQPDNIDTKAVESKLRVQKEWHREKLENTLSHLDFKGKKILDLACGSGGLTRKLKKNATSSIIFAIDSNEKAVQYARKRDKNISGLMYTAGNAESIPFKDDFFDIVIGLDMLDHVPNYKECMREINRVLKKGGKLVLTVENHYSLWPIVEFLWDKFGRGREYRLVHVVHFTPKVFEKLVMDSGFSIKKLYTIHNLNTFFYLIGNYYPKSLNSPISRKKLGLSLFCYAEKTRGIS